MGFAQSYLKSKAELWDALFVFNQFTFYTSRYAVLHLLQVKEVFSEAIAP